MRNKVLVAGLLAGLFVASAAQAEVGVTASLGTTGIGIHGSIPLQDKLNARIGVNFLNYSYSGTASNIDYDFKLKLKTVDFLLDYFPTGGDFRITGGLIYNGNKIDADGKANGAGSYTINGITYAASDIGTVNGRIDFRKIAPYLGIGWGNAVGKQKGWGFSGDLGVMFLGSPNTSLTTSNCNLGAAACDTLRTNLEVERRSVEDKANKFNAYPVIRVGVSYKF